MYKIPFASDIVRRTGTKLCFAGAIMLLKTRENPRVFRVGRALIELKKTAGSFFKKSASPFLPQM
ncbi:MAG: hypothetical protein RR287_00045 [Oscillospiraceae bacterium]